MNPMGTGAQLEQVLESSLVYVLFSCNIFLQHKNYKKNSKMNSLCTLSTTLLKLNDPQACFINSSLRQKLKMWSTDALACFNPRDHPLDSSCRPLAATRNPATEKTRYICINVATISFKNDFCLKNSSLDQMPA
ncbi:hypothetical protein HS088_TW04G00079 [Tripterygium wilfordii]|uniref:Uncharacterized protein n=1 Tax=Tripterygium wilfordii TaxID=458696 RepID=A0A7J7DPC2_TRIWF|nr:hypothetical protein HS088_TW04G00079 [Tripterygium wilfordii]